MEFELKEVVATEKVQAEDEKNSLQFLNISVGVLNNPHNMIETKTVKYVFKNTLSVQKAKDGITPFATQWVIDNYPAIP